MRKVLLLAAAAIMIPGAVSAQSAMSTQPGATMSGQADSATTIPAPTDTQSTMGAQGDMSAQSGTAPSGTTTPSNPSAMPGNTMNDSASGANTAADATASTSATTAPSAMDTGSNAAADTMSPSASANKTYPMCSKTVQDSCRNRGGK